MEENQSEELKIMPRGTAPRSLRKGRNMIAVASGKGGVGKTWFSVTLAHALSGLRQKTLLFDGDLGLAKPTLTSLPAVPVPPDWHQCLSAVCRFWAKTCPCLLPITTRSFWTWAPALKSQYEFFPAWLKK